MVRGALFTPTLTKRLSILPERRKSSRMDGAPAASSQQSMFAVCPDSEGGFVGVAGGRLLPFSTLIRPDDDCDFPLADDERFVKVVIGGRIAYAACYLPLSEQKGIKATFGTRHRAALGLAEASDAIVLVVSEETGAISLAYNANIYYNLSNSTIKRTLLSLFSYRDVLPQEAKEGANEAE